MSSTEIPDKVESSPSGSCCCCCCFRCGLFGATLCILLLAVSFPVVVGVVALGSHLALPRFLAAPVEDAFASSVRYVFKHESVDLRGEALSWSSALCPSRGAATAVVGGAGLPADLCGAYFMLGNPAPDGITDMCAGVWDASARTLTLAVSGPGAWGFNDDFQGLFGFYATWLLQLHYVFTFDANFTRASIASPIFWSPLGLPQFAEVVFGVGASFSMERAGADADVWTRISKAADGVTDLFPPYRPTRMVDCAGRVREDNVASIVAHLKDHPRYDKARAAADGLGGGGGLARQSVRRRP